MLHVAVLLGGISNEREISLKSGRQIIKHLDKKRYKVLTYDPKTQLAKLVRDGKAGRIDIAFNALHGRGGEDGAIQGLLEWIGIPYTGSGIQASAVAMDKERSKQLYRQNNIPTPPSLYVDQYNKELILKKLGSRIVIKPNADGSSVGVTVNPPMTQWKKLIELRIKTEGRCLLEAFREGKELTVGVLGNEVLPVIEIRPKTAFFDFKAKYTPGMSDELCPAPIPAKVTKEAQELALKAHRVLGCRGYSRTDMIWSKGGVEVLETNTLPGMTVTSLLPLAVSVAGLSYAKLLDRMISLASE